MITSVLPDDPGATRRDLYEGTIFHAGPTAASRALADHARALLQEALGPDYRDAQARTEPADFFARIGTIRRALFTAEAVHERVRAVIAALGFDPERAAFDPVRLRVVAHDGDRDPRAAPVYYPHRDTWYAHSQAAIAWWIPLHDCPPAETFVFYPERFCQPVPNDSERFDYDDWVRQGWGLKIGWQDRDAGLTADYPGVVGEVDAGAPLGFGCRTADNLLFAGAHFHRTLPHRAGRTRFSLDFRMVDLDDHARGLGAPNCDNRSRGAALVDYIRPAPPQERP